MKSFSQYITEEVKTSKVGNHTFKVDYKIKLTPTQKKRVMNVFDYEVRSLLKDYDVEVEIDKAALGKNAMHVKISVKKDGVWQTHRKVEVGRKGKVSNANV